MKKYAIPISEMGTSFNPKWLVGESDRQSALIFNPKLLPLSNSHHEAMKSIIIQILIVYLSLITLTPDSQYYLPSGEVDKETIFNTLKVDDNNNPGYGGQS